MDPAKQFSIVPAESPFQISIVRNLLLEYWKARKLELSVFNFDEELAGLPGKYAPPAGRLLLGYLGGEPTGCVALHRLEPQICEMKRLYLRPSFRGLGLGRALAEAVIAEARAIGYVKMRLDTIGPSMQEAVGLYRQLGFKEITAYRNNPIEGARYMELEL